VLPRYIGWRHEAPASHGLKPYRGKADMRPGLRGVFGEFGIKSARDGAYFNASVWGQDGVSATLPKRSVHLALLIGAPARISPPGSTVPNAYCWLRSSNRRFREDVPFYTIGVMRMPASQRTCGTRWEFLTRLTGLDKAVQVGLLRLAT
jgi:hypothetical protein